MKMWFKLTNDGGAKPPFSPPSPSHIGRGHGSSASRCLIVALRAPSLLAAHSTTTRGPPSRHACVRIPQQQTALRHHLCSRAGGFTIT